MKYGEANYELIRDYVKRTPVVTCDAVDAKLQATCFFKCENLQETGSFKFRGAMHALLQLDDVTRARGVVTVSSGNHGAALAKAGAVLGVDVHVILPENIRPRKLANIRQHNPAIIFNTPGAEGRRVAFEAFQAEHDCHYIPPYNHENIVKGQASAAYELLQEVPDLDIIVVPVGGGGLSSGTILAARNLSPSTKIIGAEPANADDAFRSLRDNTLYPQTNPDTICDGLRTGLGDVTFPILRDGMSEVILVTEDEVRLAMNQLSAHLQMVVEPSSATVYAAALKRRERVAGRRVGLIISGGNIDTEV